MLPKNILSNLLKFSIHTAELSSEITLSYFKKRLVTRLKENKTPVTIADLKCEEFIVKQIKKSNPSHEIFSEETGNYITGSEFKWLIDPIDGTKNFIRHIPFWGTLIALEYNREIVLGVIYLPALDEIIYAAKGMGCYCNGKKVQVSKIKTIKDAYLLYGGLHYIFKNLNIKNFVRLNFNFNESRGFGDCHGHSFIIRGMAEAMLDPITAPYDIAATKICIEEAGGKLTDLKGNDTIYGGNALISNGKFHDEILKLLNR